MIKITCQSYDQFYEVTVTQVVGLQSALLTVDRYNKQLYFSATEAIRAGVMSCSSIINQDPIEAPEHS